MFQVVNESTADSAWQSATRWFLPDGIANVQEGRTGKTTEVLHAVLSIRDSSQRWIASRVPALNPAFAIAEVVWIISGRQDSAFLNYFNPRLPEFAGDGPTYYGAYGFRLRHQFGIDQLEHAFLALNAKSDSRQIVLQIWDPRSDLPDNNGSPRSADIPCNIMSMLKIRSKRLEWTQVMRSNDLLLGLPHNIIQLTSLQEVLAGWLGVQPGSYNHVSDSLHFYERDGAVADRLQPANIPPPNSDSLLLPKVESEKAFRSLSAFGDLLTNDNNDSDKIMAGLDHLGLPSAYFNLAAILAADALRRRGCIELARRVNSQGSNNCLRVLFQRWLDRKLTEIAKNFTFDRERPGERK
jgi:thymidylate synthase